MGLVGQWLCEAWDSSAGMSVVREVTDGKFQCDLRSEAYGRWCSWTLTPHPDAAPPSGVLTFDIELDSLLAGAAPGGGPTVKKSKLYIVSTGASVDSTYDRINGSQSSLWQPTLTSPEGEEVLMITFLIEQLAPM